MKTTRRFGPENSATRTVLLDATERLMLEEGYAAVTTRRVAKEVGLTPALVHCYFKTTDDLLVALYRRSTERNLAQLTAALQSEKPLQALWDLSSDAVRTNLTMEFRALANHRKVIGVEIARYAEQARELQAEAMQRVLDRSPVDRKLFTPAGVTVLLAATARALTMEEGVGITSGHEDARAIVDWLLQRLEPRSEPQTSAV
ncbi:helix-turn-helix domain containing protein [Phenylobacterium sp. LjRoot219]|uniref:TetR/AcrR family transcriptional regulator n=1 Tax=Phenylobacterium sp. LjRoot219 TaxID=3342283 RepID=UPI003ED15C9D